MKGYTLIVTTDPSAQHLFAPKGGSRQIIKTKQGNFLISDQRSIEEDDRSFQERLKLIIKKKNPVVGESRRYEIADL